MPPEICDEGLVPDEIGAMFGMHYAKPQYVSTYCTIIYDKTLKSAFTTGNGGFGPPSGGPCQNSGICIDATHNTAFLPTNEDTGEVLPPHGMRGIMFLVLVS